MSKKDDEEGAKRKRVPRTFPASTFEEALGFAKAMLEFGSGQQVRRLTFFNHIGKSPDSGPSRQLVTNSNKYGLTEGSYAAEFLKLTEIGVKAASDEVPPRERSRARVALAIDNVPVFKHLYEHIVGNKLPAKAALVDAAHSFDVSKEDAEEAVDTFILNLRFVGLLQMLSGAERVVSIEHLLDTLPASTPTIYSPGAIVPAASRLKPVGEHSSAAHADFEKTCFYITPIGSADTEQRRHSDLFLASIVEPALEAFDLRVVRADHIDKPGIITKQILDYLINARLVIVDLSFHNPNVFYELAIRHMMKKPVVQITRKTESIPFDVSSMRTIIVDTDTIYTLVPKLDTHRAEIANQVRRALENPENADNPISMYYPNLMVTLK